MQESREFTAAAENVAAARRFVADIADRWNLGEAEWALVQIVSELASNAVIHAGTAFTVRLTRHDEGTRIEVVDASARRALTRGYDLDATTGRGLRLVARLSREWGVSRAADGKSVWAVVDNSGFDERDAESLIELFADLDDDEHLASGPVGAAEATDDMRPMDAHTPLAA
ncbi:MAG TPA: ATP-binding protein [Mycobacteriales bacterium]|nr:ATP-binding protein [Mycobacteriales bacterium]